MVPLDARSRFESRGELYSSDVKLLTLEVQAFLLTPVDLESKPVCLYKSSNDPTIGKLLKHTSGLCWI